MSVIVAGSTGAIGREVVRAAVANSAISRVVALSRRPVPQADWPTVFGAELDTTAAASKLVVQAVDWDKLLSNPITPYDTSVSTSFAGHDYAAMCMATTRKDAGSAENFRKCDLLFVEAFAACLFAHSQPTLKHFLQVSSQGASSTSWLLYMKTKGEADEAVAKIGFPRVTILRPGLLDRADKARWIEKVGMCIMPSMPVVCVGNAMVRSMVEPEALGKAVAAGPSMPPETFFLYDSQIFAIAPRPAKK